MKKRFARTVSFILMCAVMLSAGLTLASCSQPDYIEVADWQGYIVDRSLEADRITLDINEPGYSAVIYNPIELSNDGVDEIFALLSVVPSTFTKCKNPPGVYGNKNMKITIERDDKLFEVVVVRDGTVILSVNNTYYQSETKVNCNSIYVYYKMSFGG